jgi:hypothetical protein
MDVCLELLVSNPIPITSLMTRQKSITWGGIEYPQEPICYLWGEFIQIVETPIAKHIYTFLPKTYKIFDMKCYAIQGEVLNLIKKEVHGFQVNWAGKNLDSFLKSILPSQQNWAVVFSLHCDEIDSQYTLGIDEAIKKIYANLRNEPEGFIILSKLI